MKTISLLVAICVMVVANVSGQAGCAPLSQHIDQISGEVRSDMRSNIVMVLCLTQPSARQVDSPLCFGFVSTNQMAYYVFPLKPEYGYRLSAVSSDGKPVQRTRRGADFGARFETLKKWDKSKLAPPPHRWQRGPFVMIASDRLSPSNLPAPDELFRFEKPGDYIINVEVQVLSCPFGSNFTNAYPVRFPPVQVRVVKPQTK